MCALALTSKEHYRTPFEPVMPGVTFLEYGNSQSAVELIRSGKIAAVFVEPIQGEGGIYSATKEFLQALRSACDDTGCLLVFDEVRSYLVFWVMCSKMFHRAHYEYNGFDCVFSMQLLLLMFLYCLVTYTRMLLITWPMNTWGKQKYRMVESCDTITGSYCFSDI